MLISPATYVPRTKFSTLDCPLDEYSTVTSNTAGFPISEFAAKTVVARSTCESSSILWMVHFESPRIFSDSDGDSTVTTTFVIWAVPLFATLNA